MTVIRIGRLDDPQRTYPVVVRPGEIVSLDRATFTYTGPEQMLFICWGLKRRRGASEIEVPFNNGGGLYLGQFAANWITVPAVVNQKFDVPILADLVIPSETEQATYDTFIWVSKSASTKEADMLMNIDTDRDVVSVE